MVNFLLGIYNAILNVLVFFVQAIAAILYFFIGPIAWLLGSIDGVLTKTYRKIKIGFS